MAKNMKTPAMILQEYTVKEGIAPPEYNLIFSKTGTHENEFHYQVTAGGVSAVGFGRSKQVAKHDAAQKAIQLLTERGKCTIDTDSVQEFNAKLHRNETDSRSDPPVNFVGTLKDLCMEQKIPYPTFVEISDVGPPHARQFTWKCIVSSIITQATANTKKQAKQLCAKDMLDRLKDVMPEIVQEEELRKRAITQDETVISKYVELSSLFGIIPNKAIKISDYDTVIKTLMKERNLTFEDFTEEMSARTEASLEQLLSKLELTYRFDEVQNEDPCITVLSISVDVPLSCIGIGSDSDEAKSDSLNEVFKTLTYYMTID